MNDNAHPEIIRSDVGDRILSPIPVVIKTRLMNWNFWPFLGAYDVTNSHSINRQVYSDNFLKLQIFDGTPLFFV